MQALRAMVSGQTCKSVSYQLKIDSRVSNWLWHAFIDVDNEVIENVRTPLLTELVVSLNYKFLCLHGIYKKHGEEK